MASAIVTGRTSRFVVVAAAALGLLGGLAPAMPAAAQPRHDDRRPPPRVDHRRDWHRPGYYAGPPVAYAPPPVVYAPPPPPGLNLMFNIR